MPMRTFDDADYAARTDQGARNVVILTLCWQKQGPRAVGNGKG